MSLILIVVKYVSLFLSILSSTMILVFSRKKDLMIDYSAFILNAISLTIFLILQFKL